MSKLIQNAITDFFECDIQNLEFMRDNLDVRLKKLTKWLKTEGINENEEAVLRDFASECTARLQGVRTKIRTVNARHKIVKEERAKANEIKSQESYYDPKSDNSSDSQ